VLPGHKRETYHATNHDAESEAEADVATGNQAQHQHLVEREVRLLLAWVRRNKSGLGMKGERKHASMQQDDGAKARKSRHRVTPQAAGHTLLTVMSALRVYLRR
jgi:hypothetical protein